METLKIYQKWEDMLTYLYPAARAYPKAERFTLASRTIDKALELGLYIVRANSLRNTTEKRSALEQADIALAELKILARLAMRIQSLPVRKYENLSVMLVEIGKMLGGWMRSTWGQAAQ
jgi:hypothetical protein